MFLGFKSKNNRAINFTDCWRQKLTVWKRCRRSHR